MKCPSCGNYAKPVSSVIIGFSLFSFKCQYCNDRLRGGALMVFFDLLSISLYIGYAFLLVAYAEPLAPLFGEMTFPLLGLLGLIGIRGPLAWLKMKIGTYVLSL